MAIQTTKDYFSLPDDATIERVDLIVDTAPTGQAIIVDIERSVDGGTNWSSIFSSGNRPQVVAGAKTGNTTTVDTPGAVGNSTLFRAKIAQIGSTVAGADLSVILRAKYDVD